MANAGRASDIRGAVGLVAALLVLPKDVPLEECLRRAGLAAEARRPVRALEWTRRALAHAPDNPLLHSDEGFFLEWLGRNDASLAAYARAAELGDGEAELLAARLRLRLHHEIELAVGHLVRALDRAPHLAADIREDAAVYGPVLDDPRVMAALAEADARPPGA